MTPQQYIDRNLKGFEGDSFIKKKFEYFRDKFNIDTVIETGTYLGGTTKVLSEMFRWVFTIELTEEMWHRSGEYLKGVKNVSRLHGSSDTKLDLLLFRMVPELNKNEVLMFFLDAHFYDHCPLLGELKAIADHKIKPVIAIHDFQVPGRPELGFDTWNGQDFTFEWIADSLDAIYGKGNYHWNYNDDAEGAMRGIIYVYPA